MCSKGKTDAKVKWLLVALAMINATSLAIYFLIQILTLENHLSANFGEPQLSVNNKPSTVRKNRVNANTSSAFRSSETIVAYLYTTKIKFDDSEFEVIFRDPKFGEVRPLAKGEFNIAHTCGYSLLDTGEPLDKAELKNVTRRLLENRCTNYP